MADAVLSFFTFGDEEVKRILTVVGFLPKCLLLWIADYIDKGKR